MFVKAKQNKKEIFIEIENFDFIIYKDGKIFAGWNFDKGGLKRELIYRLFKTEHENDQEHDFEEFSKNYILEETSSKYINDYFNLFTYEIDYDNFENLKKQFSGELYLEGEHYKMIFFKKSVGKDAFIAIREDRKKVYIFIDECYKSNNSYIIAQFPHPGNFKLSII